jgi:hypothetical protein
MSERSLWRRRAVALACAAAVLLGALATLMPPGRAQAAPPSQPTPRLRLSWAVSTFRCWTATERIQVRRGKKVTIHKRRVRRCGERPTRVRGRKLHLRWRQTGEAFGHLTIGKQPIAGAQVTLSWTIPGWQAGTNVVTTNAHGRFTMVIPGPSKILTISYSPAPGQLIAVTKRVDSAASVSLHISALSAGRKAHFYGVVRGGYIPENLYVEFWYLAGSAGWQPFAQPTLVGREHGHWNTHIRSPGAAAGYFYAIKASVVPTPTWPWAHTESGVVSRYVP